MLKKIILPLLTLSSLSLAVSPTFAQFMPTNSGATGSLWGSGVYGGTQGCSYQRSMGAGAQSENDEIREIQDAIQEMTKQKKQKQTEMSRVEKRDMRDSQRGITEVLSADYADFVIDHMNTGRSCYEYKGIGDGNSVIAAGEEGGTAVQSPGTQNTEPFSAKEWGQLCDRSKSGSVSGSVCSNAKFRVSDKTGSTLEDCRKGLTEYRKQKLQKDKLLREIADLERSIKVEKDRLKDAKEDARQAQRDGLSSPNGQGSPNSDTEGGVCVNCIASGNGYTYQKPQTDWMNVLANVGTGALATYMGYKSQQMVTDANANLGYPTQQSYPAWGYGMPYFAQGIYGALGGSTGRGGFGCGSGSGNSAGGAFGYPQNMMGMNTMGGGLYLGGMNPWSGMNGMSGMNSLYGGMGNYGLNMNGMMNLGNMGGMFNMGNMMNTGYGNMMSSGNSLMDPSMMQLQMQYQQQATQMQMQYYQTYQQQQTQRYQSMMSLQQEMTNLVYKMQAIQNGYSGTTNYIGGNTGTLSSTYSSVPVGGLISNGYYNYNGNYLNNYGPSAIPVPTTSTSLYGIYGSGR